MSLSLDSNQGDGLDRSSGVSIGFPAQLLPLICGAMNYPWGKLGGDSKVAQLLPESNPQKPYAELWVGAHANNPSKVVRPDGSTQNLQDIIAESPEAILGKRVVEKFGTTLPFLFKILSVAEPLSIQAHPDKELAKKLHERDAKNYPDDNHKPEVAIALTELRMLYGFKLVEELKREIDDTPELKELLGEELVSKLSEFDSDQGAEELLKELYSAVVNSDISQRVVLGTRMRERLTSKPDKSDIDLLSLDMANQYGESDIGIFACYMMNYCIIPAGSAVYNGPNIPHAYLSGDLVECMANSDNVVRAGFTNKFQDAATLVDMLTYESGPAAIISGTANSQNHSLIEHPVPVSEFAISEVTSNAVLELETKDSLALIFCLEGGCTVESSGKTESLAKGKSLLVPAWSNSYKVNSGAGSRVFLVTVP